MVAAVIVSLPHDPANVISDECDTTAYPIRDLNSSVEGERQLDADDRDPVFVDANDRARAESCRIDDVLDIFGRQFSEHISVLSV